jgi:2-dehydro-3-deoxyphosphogluconate aldolase/(4S)-4-hydroxy-2-oxoglutarate aldolase
MEKEKVLEWMRERGVIAIFRVETREQCFRAMEALLNGGQDILEVAMTTPNAIELIREASEKYRGRALIGVGTVLDGETAARAIDAGAEFVVGPSLHKDVIDVCKERGVVCIPGTFTATEVVTAWKWGADLIKVFPVSQVGPSYIKALRGPLPNIPLVPTGGVDVNNAADFIKVGAYCLGVGGALVSMKAIRAGRYEELTEYAKKLLAVVREAREG